MRIQQQYLDTKIVIKNLATFTMLCRLDFGGAVENEINIFLLMIATGKKKWWKTNRRRYKVKTGNLKHPTSHKSRGGDGDCISFLYFNLNSRAASNMKLLQHKMMTFGYGTPIWFNVHEAKLVVAIVGVTLTSL